MDFDNLSDHFFITLEFNRDGNLQKHFSTLFPLDIDSKQLMTIVENWVTDVLGSLPTLIFIDDEGDRVLLENLDSHTEAIKVAQKTGKLTIIAEERRKLSADNQITIDPITPTWFLTEMQKMKTDLKNEILTEIGKATKRRARQCSTSPAPKTSYRKDEPGSKTESKTTVVDNPIEPIRQHPYGDAPKKMRKGDYISRSIKQNHELLNELSKATAAAAETSSKLSYHASGGGARPKTTGKGDYICRALIGGGLKGDVGEKSTVGQEGLGKVIKEPIILCGACRQNVGEPYFMCLDGNCLITLCGVCENLHPSGHAMLRLPKRLNGGRRRAASTAQTILLSMNTSKQSSSRENKKYEKKLCKIEEKALKKAAKMEHKKGKVDWVLMEVVTGDEGLTTVTWMIVNTGKKQWDDDMKLTCIANSDAELKPLIWELSVPHLKPGGDTQVNVKLTTPNRAGEYKTHWILARRGKRFADLTATFSVLEKNLEDEGQVIVEHSYALQKNESQQDVSPSSETFERIDYQDIDDVCSVFSDGITVCKSSAVEQDYDLVPENDDPLSESVEEADYDKDSSYVSIASPVQVDENSENTEKMTEMWQRLTISLSPLTAPNMIGSDVSEPITADLDVEVVEEPKLTAALECGIDVIERRQEEKKVTAGVDCGIEMKERQDDEPVIVHESINIGNEVEDATIMTESVQPEEPAIESSVDIEEARTVDSNDEPFRGSFSSSRSTSFDNKRHQFGESVSNKISNVLLSTTQTLATVGATAKEIHTMAAAIVRTNFQGGHSTSPKESWQPPRAWVPKGTQTNWTPPMENEKETLKDVENPEEGYNPYERQMRQLTEMGFCDLTKNEELLYQHHGNVDRVVLALLDDPENLRKFSL